MGVLRLGPAEADRLRDRGSDCSRVGREGVVFRLDDAEAEDDASWKLKSTCPKS